MTDEELEDWVKNLMELLNNDGICLRKRKILEMQLLNACKELTKRKNQSSQEQ